MKKDDEPPAVKLGRGARQSRRHANVWAVALAVLLSGCVQPRPAPSAVRIPNRAVGRAAVAVAPAINLSGSTDFDPSRVADLMAVELTYAEGLSVVPVSRVLGVLAAQGKNGIESPAHAVEVLQWLGADAMLVFAITEYVPYEPPRVGISAQIFADVADPKLESKSADEQGIESGLAAGDSSVRVLAETQRVFDASQDAIVRDIQQFAANRTADESPYGWRKYVVSQEGFLRFCCHQTATQLLSQEPRPVKVAEGK